MSAPPQAVAGLAWAIVGPPLLVFAALRVRRGRTVLHAGLMIAAVVENFGYRQWLAIVRTKALWTVLRPDTGWGEMTRVGFSEPVPAVAQACAPRSPSPRYTGTTAAHCSARRAR